ncbi:MAG: hypothetical protein U0324_35340 [Polyangiales bacterium]
MTTTPDATTGATSVEIPLASCPTTPFDCADVTRATPAAWAPHRRGVGATSAPDAPRSPVTPASG